MTLKDIAVMRMYNQGIEGRKFKTPEEVVRHMGAIQAQDYNAAVLAVALRLEKPNIQAVEKAIAAGKIIRTWPMRRTIHFIHRDDAPWMLDLLLPIALRGMGPRGEQVYGLTPDVIKKAEAIVRKALRGGKVLTRPELYEALDKGGVASRDDRAVPIKFYSATGRGLHILVRLAHERVICFGPRQGKQPTFIVCDHLMSAGKPKAREQAITDLAIRYFTSHGPAQIKDFQWWSGLTIKEIKQGIELAGKKLTSLEVEGKTYYMAPAQPKIKVSGEAHLLPAFDEFLVAYKDRNASLEEVHAKHYNPGANGMLSPIIVVDGQVIATWRKKSKEISIHPFTKFTPVEKQAIDVAVNKYHNS